MCGGSGLRVLWLQSCVLCTVTNVPKTTGFVPYCNISVLGRAEVFGFKSGGLSVGQSVLGSQMVQVSNGWLVPWVFIGNDTHHCAKDFRAIIPLSGTCTIGIQRNY